MIFPPVIKLIHMFFAACTQFIIIRINLLPLSSPYSSLLCVGGRFAMQNIANLYSSRSTNLVVGIQTYLIKPTIDSLQCPTSRGRLITRVGQRAQNIYTLQFSAAHSRVVNIYKFLYYCNKICIHYNSVLHIIGQLLYVISYIIVIKYLFIKIQCCTLQGSCHKSFPILL